MFGGIVFIDFSIFLPVLGCIIDKFFNLESLSMVEKRKIGLAGRKEKRTK
jgi:hypothetical protein